MLTLFLSFGQYVGPIGCVLAKRLVDGKKLGPLVGM